MNNGLTGNNQMVNAILLLRSDFYAGHMYHVQAAEGIIPDLGAIEALEQ